MSGYRRALGELYALAPKGIEPGLERVRAALERVGHPERAFDVVHIAGTNGKGSTARMIAEGIVDRRVGLFTSPHLHSLTERFVVDGQPIERGELVAAWDDLRDRLHDLTFFETVTVLAFEIFRRRGVEIAVLETGLGGRLDATNVVAQPRVTAITRIALDHQSWLGDDLASVAREKAGIIKERVACVIGAQDPEVEAVLCEVAARLGAPLTSPTFDGPELALAGAHQRENAAVALGALRVLREQGEEIDEARALRAEWPGRLERCGRVLLDAAHNPSAAAALARHLDGLEPGPRVLLFGAMRDKDWPAMLDLLRPHVSHVVLTAPELARAARPGEMSAPGDHVVDDPGAALDRARSLAGETGLVVVAGSIFLVAEVRARVLGVEGDPPIAL